MHETYANMEVKMHETYANMEMKMHETYANVRFFEKTGDIEAQDGRPVTRSACNREFLFQRSRSHNQRYILAEDIWP